MKKKIVYISGSDAFDMNDVRAAFDEVRSTLNLGADTILFGVPVDADEEYCTADSVKTTTQTEPNPEIVNDTVLTGAASESVIETPTVTVEEKNSTETVVPILSVLASKNQDKSGKKDVIQDEVISDGKMTDEPEPVELSDAEYDTNEVTENEDFTDILDTDAPVDSHEKTLEELLETMEPLREDTHMPVESFEPAQNTPTQSDEVPVDDVDATLENLASEFVKSEDKMPITKKTSERGKIGRLKNILPFKKMKKDDSGLMGDLFGWAGIAANDEDFSIPGFFTNAASKK